MSKPRASTDMGNVSYVVPSVHAYVSIGDPKKIGNTHSPEFAPQTATPEGHSALLNAAKAMAMTTVDLLSDLSLVDKSRSIHAEQMRKELGN